MPRHHSALDVASYRVVCVGLVEHWSALECAVLFGDDASVRYIVAIAAVGYCMVDVVFCSFQ